MLNRREAQETIRKLRREDGESRRRAAVNQLPTPLCSTAWQVLGYTEQGQAHPRDNWSARYKEQQAAARKLEVMAPADRLAIFEALSPRLGSYLEAGWQFQKQIPYRLGGNRRAFRLPHRPEISLDRRLAWVNSILSITCDYDEQSLTWWAEWAGYFWHSYDLGALFAAAIDLGDPAGNEVFEILTATARGEHSIGLMGRHVVQGLLSASRPDGWRLIEQLLIAAQRQEGLRQVILETVDEAHPEAFRRMVHLIREQELTRFSSVVRAVNVWFGLGWEATDSREVKQTITWLDDWLADEAACLAALTSDDPQAVYLALCVLAFDDAGRAAAQAQKLLVDPRLEHRFIAAYCLVQLELPETRASLLSLLADQELRLAVVALQGLFRTSGWYPTPMIAAPDLFETLEALIPRLPAQQTTLEPLVWPWLRLATSQQAAADRLLAALGDRPLARLKPYLNLMSPRVKWSLIEYISRDWPNDPTAREMLLQLMGDRSASVRGWAIEAGAKLDLSEAEMVQLEGYLTRKAGDLRRGILGMLLGRTEVGAILASAGRLLAATQPLQRQAGLELLRHLVEQERLASQAQALAASYAEDRPHLPEAEQALLAVILAQKQPVATLADGLGLFDSAQRTPLLAPNPQPDLLHESSLVSPAAVACLRALDELVHTYRETPIRVKWRDNEVEEPLGNLLNAFPQPDRNQPVDQDIARLPLAEVWLDWWANRPEALRDADGLELLRALAPLEAGPDYSRRFRHNAEPAWSKEAIAILYGPLDVEQLGYASLIEVILWWLVRRQPPIGAANFLLAALEHSFSLLPTPANLDWHHEHRLMSWLTLARQHRLLCPAAWTGDDYIRLWRLLRWLDEPGRELSYFKSHLDEVMRAYLAGGANRADLLDHLLGPASDERRWSFNDLGALSGRRPNLRHSEFAEHPDLVALVEQCRRRIVEVELQRGDLPTAASAPALALRCSGGLATLMQLLAAFGREKFARGYIYHGQLNKQAVFSHLIRVTFPADGDTPEQFAAQAKQLKLSQNLLVETAVYAPQWAGHIEQALGWPGLAEAVWWLHAHTKDRYWRIDLALREQWQAEASERTRLTGQELLDGAVDVAWFRRVYSALGQERWQALYEAAKYASGGNGHRRAQLFAEAMLEQVDQATLAGRVVAKRNQDAVRSIGLLPLPAGAKPDEVILERYKLIQEFMRGSRKFGSQRQASEKLAARIGLENLARTAGYPDPVRLEWAMETQAVADLAAGPLTVTAEQTTVTLAIDPWGEAQLSVSKNGRPLKAVPASLKKQPEVAALLARKPELKQQTARMRQSLELAMCRGDCFSPAELGQLMQHPLLKPMLSQLVFVDESGSTIGYPVEGGAQLLGLAQRLQPVLPSQRLRLAHPHDLLQSGAWHLWQQDCFRRELIQPFKQLFRELYVLTAAEKAEGIVSRRYAGHQVNPRQALALLGQRGWVSHPEEGIRRTFHDEGVAAWLSFLGGYYSPAEVEGLTLEGVHFARQGEWRSLRLEEIPPRLFSEVMRDLDLVVSVAHQGGVDPEATASTVEMRAALIRETCAMLEIDNVRLQSNHVFIDGRLNHYSVHLGSGVVHQQPGGYVCIVPVHSQHRGRLFLPFADDDPKTAEVMAKILLLARDWEIKDPTILQQLTIIN
jgi:hypothetical protein